jgi:hypothetical protein
VSVGFVAMLWRRVVPHFSENHLRHSLVADAERPCNISVAHALSLQLSDLLGL